CAAGEAWQPRDRRSTRLTHQVRQVIERCNVACEAGITAIANQLVHCRTVIAIHCPRFGAEYGVASPALATLEGFKQEAVIAAVQLCERRHGSVAVEHHLASERVALVAVAPGRTTAGEHVVVVDHGGVTGAAMRNSPGSDIVARSMSPPGRLCGRN